MHISICIFTVHQMGRKKQKQTKNLESHNWKNLGVKGFRNSESNKRKRAKKESYGSWEETL